MESADLDCLRGSRFISSGSTDVGIAQLIPESRPDRQLRSRVGADVVDPKPRRARRLGDELVLHRERDAHEERTPRFREGREAGQLLAVEINDDPVARDQAPVTVELAVEHAGARGR